jgi:hypothetical protein
MVNKKSFGVLINLFINKELNTKTIMDETTRIV